MHILDVVTYDSCTVDDNETIENSAFIDVDKSKYLAGTKKALGKFLSFHTQEFAEKTK